MKFYVSFGQIHVHSINGITIDKDCIVELDVDSHVDARNEAWELFQGVFHNVYTSKPDMSYFPRGIIRLTDHPGGKEG